MTGHNRIPTKAPLISTRRFIALCESMILSLIACLLLFLVIA
jgi:hypothetical protein